MRRHLTVVEDAVVDRVAEELGASALGVYTLLERRVGRDGRAVVSYEALGAACRLSKRQVIRVVAALVEAGLVTVHGREGNRGNLVELPLHIKGSDTGGDTGSDTGGVVGGDAPIGVSKSKSVSKRSSQGSRGSRGTKLPDLTPDEERVWFDEAVRLGVAEERVLWVVAQFRDYWRANGGVKVDWLSAWRTWCRNELQWRGERNARATAGAESVAAVLDRRRAERAQEVG